jgi:Protein of unknown function (DUF2946)
MRWFRSNIYFGSRLALFAMALQFALTFGHIHQHGFLPSTAKSTVADQAGQPASNSPLHKSNGSADFNCPICALIRLASTSTPSVAPQLPVPVTFVVVRQAAGDEAALLASPRGLFQARGPPSI